MFTWEEALSKQFSAQTSKIQPWLEPEASVNLPITMNVAKHLSAATAFNQTTSHYQGKVIPS